MKTSLFIAVALLVLATAGCTPWRAKYLAEANGKASQDTVAQRLGAPRSTYKLKSGGEVWSYEYCKGTVAGSDGNIHGVTRCDNYVLTFDERGILQNWERQK
jgi:hypothetical protein